MLFVFLSLISLVVAAEPIYTENQIIKEFVYREIYLPDPIKEALITNIVLLSPNSLASFANDSGFYYGLAIFCGDNERLLDAAKAIAIQSALRDKALSSDVFKTTAINSELTGDLSHFILSTAQYQVGELEKVITFQNSEWIGSLIIIPSDRVSVSIDTKLNLGRFGQILYFKGIVLYNRRLLEPALTRFEWIVENEVQGQTNDLAHLYIAMINADLGKIDQALTALLPLFRYDDYQLFQTFKADEIALMLSVLERLGLEDKAIEIAAVATALYPNHSKLQILFNELISK